MFLLHACGGGSKGSDSGAGGLVVRPVYDRSSADLQSKAADIDCDALRVVHVEAAVYASDGKFLQGGGPWECSRGNGTIASVPAGGHRVVVILGKDSDGNLVLRGQKPDIQIHANQVNNAGTIGCEGFATTLRAPVDGSVVNGDNMGLVWDAVAGAAEYQVQISEDSGLNEPLTRDEVVTAETYTPQELSNNTTYYWRIIAVDAYGNKGIDSEIRSFTVNTEHQNTSPVARIDAPAQDSTYTTSDTIEFSGSASDDEDGDLSGTSLVWQSDVDGQIGTGKTFTSDALSAGAHQITLTATDADGAAGTAAVAVTVRDLGPHGIMFLDSADDVGMHSAISVDGGRIFIGYYDETHNKLKVGRSLNDGYDWTYTTVESSEQMGEGSSIVLDGENVFITTTIGGNIGLSLSRDNGETWSATPIPIEHPGNGKYDEFATSIAVDGQNIYITYLSHFLIMHILKSPYSADDWDVVRVHPPPDDAENGYHSSIHEYNGMLYVSHSGYTVGDVYLTKIDNTLANPVHHLVDQVGVMGNMGYTTSALRRIDNRINVFIAYYDQSEGNLDLKFGRSVNDASTFSLSTIDSSSDNIGRYPSMGVSGNTIFIAYYDETNGNLMLARSSNYGDTWERQTVDDSTDNVGRFACLAVDGQKVYICYYDETNKDLKFAKSIDGGETW